MSRRRMFPVFATGPRPKHPAGRWFSRPGGFRREPPVPDFAASHLAGSGFLYGLGATLALKCISGYRNSRTFPLGDASSPEVVSCRCGGAWAIGQVLSPVRLLISRLYGRLNSPTMHLVDPSEVTSTLRRGALSRSGPFPGKPAGLRAALIRRDADNHVCDRNLSSLSDGPVVTGCRHLLGATRLARYGKRLS